MKIIDCPLNGPRNSAEFVHGGELKRMPDPRTLSDAQWADYVFNSDNRAGRVIEWWMHVPSSYWFLAERDTVSDEIRRTFDPGELFVQRVDFAVHGGER